jgi:hypothetical protein
VDQLDVVGRLTPSKNGNQPFTKRPDLNTPSWTHKFELPTWTPNLKTQYEHPILHTPTCTNLSTCTNFSSPLAKTAPPRHSLQWQHQFHFPHHHQLHSPLQHPHSSTNYSLKYLHPAHASIWRWIFLLHAVACIDVFIILVINSEPTSVGIKINHRGSTPNLDSKPTN